jgi:hypothetical protein
MIFVTVHYISIRTLDACTVTTVWCNKTSHRKTNEMPRAFLAAAANAAGAGMGRDGFSMS